MTGMTLPQSAKFLVAAALALCAAALHAQTPTAPKVPPQKVILDTDIGDDIDDAFALALALRSPELQVLGISTTFGDTQLRAQLLDRYLRAVGRTDIPILAGPPTPHNNVFTQAPYAHQADGKQFPDAVTFILDQIRANPNQITLIAIGPLSTVASVIQKDPDTFRKLRRVVLMGGSVDRGYGDLGYDKPHGPDAEWNIAQNIPGARALFTSGVTLYVMPLDSTQLELDEIKRAKLFSHGSPLTDQLTLLYHQWGRETPTLFDPMTLAFAIQPGLCPVTPIHLEIDDQGYTRRAPGKANANVCLQSSPEQFFRFLMPRLLHDTPGGP